MKKSIVKNRRYNFGLKILFYVFIVSVVILGGILNSMSFDSEQAALFADNVLRPLIGDKATIQLEGFGFGIQDNINHFSKHQPTPNSYISTIKIPPPAVSVIKLPPNITPYIDTSTSLSGEGKWDKIDDTDMYTTFIRTDPTRPYSVVNLVFIPMKKFDIAEVAGTKYPGGPNYVPGTGMIPLDIQRSGKLTAAFNGGFKEKDGHYGMYSDDVMYVPLKKSMATFFIYKDGHVEIKSYDGNPLPRNVVGARQNGPFLVFKGKTTKDTSQGVDMWAGTATGGYITWRSGLGITNSGDLIYAVGPSLTPTALADALRLATSVNAIELDINDFWVRFNLFTWNVKDNSYTTQPLIKGLANGGSGFLRGYEKDFFYLYKK